MDTEFDFIQPEFLETLFFQQKNLVVFPYVDLKHLHSLEIFTAGHSVVDLESTALYNLKEIIEFEAINSYSQNKSLYFIYNLNQDKISEIMNIPDIRCVLNTNENVSSLVEGTTDHNFIFYNKKNKRFLNYDKSDSDLEFETHLISSSENITVLHEKIQKIKIVATRIFMEINRNPNLDNLPEILKDYDRQFWPKILTFVKFYFNVEVPGVDKIESIPSQSGWTQKNTNFVAKKPLKDFSEEYELIVTSNKLLAREFILLLHDYRSEKVNPSNLELEELFNPQKLYNYLRNHHWKDGISEDFLFDWVQMSRTKYQLAHNDADDFEILLKKLNVNKEFIGKLLDKIIVEGEEIEKKIVEKEFYGTKPLKNKFITIKKPLDIPDNNVPSVRNFSEFKKWLVKKIKDIEKFID